jgi:putative lipase involved disintegration of autophagic bodies
MSIILYSTGHSLGGALASLVALTFDLPSFTYETPGDLLFAKRLGLLPPAPPTSPPTPPHLSPASPHLQSKADGKPRDNVGGGLDDWEPYLETLPIFQFGNDVDPVYIGQCKSVTSSCWFGGVRLFVEFLFSISNEFKLVAFSMR